MDVSEVKDGCIFCSIARGDAPAEIVHQDDRVVAFRDIARRAPLHVLVIPREHITSIAGATDRDLVGHLVLTATKIAADAGFASSGFRVVTNTGPDGGQAVAHLHFHVLGGRRLGPPW
jgi:histidine triad (HIT) family protein